MHTYVYIQPPGSVITQYGTDVGVGIIPEDVQVTADLHGDATATFTLRRSAGVDFPDLQPYTKVWVVKGGSVIFQGRIKETPATTGDFDSVNVVCDGMQAHLQDKVIDRYYLNADLQSWVDARAFTDVDKNTYTVPWEIRQEEGSTVIAFTDTVGASTRGGIYIDTGQKGCTGAIVTYRGGGNSNLSLRWYLGTIEPTSLPTSSGTIAATLASTATTTATINPGTQGRYLHLYVENISAGGVSTSASAYCEILSVTLFRESSYILSNAPYLKASDVIIDAVTAGCTDVVAREGSPSYRRRVLDDFPLAYWRFATNHPGDVNAYDEVGDNTLTANTSAGSLSWQQPGGLQGDICNSAISVTGGSYLSTSAPVSIQTKGWTLESIFRPTSASQAGTIICNGNTQGWGLSICNGTTITTAGSRLVVNLEGVAVVDIQTVSVNTWYHVLASMTTAGLLTVWVNGSQVYSATPSAPTAPNTATYIGSKPASVRPFTGDIDEVAVYEFGLDTTLGAQVALRHYEASLARKSGYVTRTAFSIPHFVGEKTNAADYIEAANSFHGYQWKIVNGTAGDTAQVAFNPIPDEPTMIARIEEGVTFQDASRNDGSDIYNRFHVKYTDAYGIDRFITREPSSFYTRAGQFPISTGAISNSGFEVNTTGWTVSLGTATRVSTPTPPASTWAMKLTSNVGGNVNAKTTLTGLDPGKTYLLTGWVRAVSGTVSTGGVSVLGDIAYDNVEVCALNRYTDFSATNINSNQWSRILYSFVCPNYASTLELYFLASGLGASADWIVVDDIQIYQALPVNVIDRAGIVRSKVVETGLRLSDAAANEIARQYVNRKTKIGLRGTLTVQSDAIVDYFSGQPIPNYLLSRKVGDCISLSNVTDPDTGALGRLGIIAGVSYNAETNEATIELDNQRDFFDILLNRFGVWNP